MTLRTGDPAALPCALQTIYGVPLSYGTAAAFLADGWTTAWSLLGAAVTAPTISAVVQNPGAFADILTYAGQHDITFAALPVAGIYIVNVVNANPNYLSMYGLVVVVMNNDFDSLAALLSGTIGQASPGGQIVNAPQLTTIEQSTWEASFNIPASLLQVLNAAGSAIYQWSSLAAIGGQPWRVFSQARYQTENGQLPSTPVAWTNEAYVTNPVTNQVTIGANVANTIPAAQCVDDLPATLGTVTLSSQTVQSVAVASGGHYYGSNVPTVQFVGGGGTGAAAHVVIVNGQVTSVVIDSPGSGYTSAPTASLVFQSPSSVLNRQFSYDIWLQPPVGSPFASETIAVLTGTHLIVRRQSTTV